MYIVLLFLIWLLKIIGFWDVLIFFIVNILFFKFLNDLLVVLNINFGWILLIIILIWFLGIEVFIGIYLYFVLMVLIILIIIYGDMWLNKIIGFLLFCNWCVNLLDLFINCW